MDKRSTDKQILDIIESQRQFFRSKTTLDVSWRIAQLKKLKQAVIDHESDIEDALRQDLGRSRVEAYLCDIGPVIAEINEMLSKLKKWSRPECHFSGLLCFPSLVTRVYKMPYGVTLLLSPYNFPIMLTLGMLATSLSAGNTAVIKPSSKSPACTALLGKLIAEIFPKEYVSVIVGNHDTADFLLEQRFDKIFYTGSPAVARKIMAAAATNLTPVALELGGETGNWCIIRKDADIKDAARKIAFFKSLNAGQICININQVAIAKEIAPQFIDALKDAFRAQLGDNPVHNKEYPRLISAAAYEKCSVTAAQYSDSIVFGGKGDATALKFEPTIIYPVDVDDSLVQRELFSPLLPVVEFDDEKIGDLLETISERERALALYIFSGNRKWARKVMREMQYGGGCINEVCVHLMVKGVPFNGVGHSGIGAYHGEWGFREFTHPQTVLEGSTRLNLSLREHPYSGRAEKIKLAILRLFER